MTKLEPKEAMSAMSAFIELYVSRVGPPDHFLGDLLGDMQCCEDGSTSDAGAWHDWLKAVEKVVGQRADAKLSPEQAFRAMEFFVSEYGARINNAKEVTDFLNTLRPLAAARQNEWLACVGKAGGATT